MIRTELLFLGAGVLCTAWILALFISGGVTGWRALAARYPAVHPRDGRRILIGKCWLGRLRYGNLICMYAGASHLHIALWPRIGHPPFSVPWEHVRLEHVPHWRWRSLTQLSFTLMPDRYFRMFDVDAKRLLASAPAGKPTVRELPGTRMT